MDFKNIKIMLSYDGSGYAGWQKLKNEGNKRTIQSILEEVLSLVLEEKIKVIGSGRTDKGVHAIGQVANFKCHTKLTSKEIQCAVNEVLPEGIWIMEVMEVSLEFHSRKSAIKKMYEYHFEIGEVPSVFHRKYVYPVQDDLDISAMEKAAGFLTGTHDFRAFSSEKREDYDTVRRIDRLSIESIKVMDFQRESKQVRILVTGSGFLYNMVRIIAGTLLEVGQHKRKAEEVKAVLLSKKRENAGITVPPEGLYLKEVTFPVEIEIKIK